MQNTTLIYLVREGHMLLIHKNSGCNEGKWIGVGGHMEENESPWDCVRREVAEETGLTLRSARFRGVVTFVSDTWEGEQMFLFTSEDFTGETGVCSEGELRWVPLGKVSDMPTWAGDRIFLSLIQKDAEPFLLKLVYTGDDLTGVCLNGKESI